MHRNNGYLERSKNIRKLVTNPCTVACIAHNLFKIEKIMQKINSLILDFNSPVLGLLG
jgi:hypothetical protein